MKLPLYIFIIVASSFFLIGSRSISNTDQKGKTYINPFDTIKYDKVIAYDYEGSPEMQIVMKGYLIGQQRIKLKKELTKLQVGKLNKTTGDTKSYGNTTAACFDPHLGFVFYKQDKIVGHISICLSCNYLQSSPKIPATHSHKTELCDECYAYGFSKSGRGKISELCKELGFSHWELNSDLFDK